jgi:condensin-2 complex subunit G2
MKKILPRISDCLHDLNDSVRVAVIDLLAEIKSVKSIRYWDICPLDDLLARLEVDKPATSQKIVKLLMNSFFPKETDEDTKVRHIMP